ncbi:MAG: ferritin-like domain-containing protein, partial [Chloroflexota bacterium]
GGTPPNEPAASALHFPALHSQTDVLNFALALENVAVGAYAGAIRQFQNVALIQTLASIFGVEAKHVAVLRSVLGQDPLPDSFVSGASSSVVQSTTAQILGTNAAPQTPAAMPNTGGGWGATQPGVR